jgi:ligand-binding sensor domain-containing protein
VIWIGTTLGLSGFEDGRFTTFENDPHLATGVSAILEDLHGYMWIATGTLVLRVSRDDLTSTHSFSVIPRQTYDAADGLSLDPVLVWTRALSPRGSRSFHSASERRWS